MRKTNICAFVCITMLLFSPSLGAEELYNSGEPVYQFSSPAFSLTDYPTDPTSDIKWNSTGCGKSGVTDVQCAFNAARTEENGMLGTAIPMLSLPAQATWDAMSDGEKALWLINRERLDRSVEALHGIETNVTGMAQYYADYLLENNKFSHDADGRTPWQRLSDNPTIGACQDFLNIAENLAVFWTGGGSIPLPVERAVYNWMYDDSTASIPWGHRHAVLWYPYNDNSGPNGVEGFLGIGRASGPHKGYNFGEIIVMNVFDPCEDWIYPAQGPEIDIKGNGRSIAVGDHIYFGKTSTGTSISRIYTIVNTGSEVLNLTGTPYVTLNAGCSSEFSITQQPTTSELAADGGTTAFTVQYSPTNTGSDTCTVTVENDDSNENPYTFTIQGTEGIDEGADWFPAIYHLLL